MKVRITFKHIDHTPILDKKIHEKSNKLAKIFGDNPTNANWNCYQRDGLHFCDVKFIGPSFEYHASGKSENFYKTLDIVTIKLEKQLKRKKSKWKEKKGNKSVTEVTSVEIVVHEDDGSDWEDVA